MFPIKLRSMRIKKKKKFKIHECLTNTSIQDKKFFFFIYKIIKFNITIYFNLTEESKVHNLYIYT